MYSGTKMISINLFEKAIRAALDNDRAQLISIINTASDEARERKQRNMQQRLKELARTITPAKSSPGYGPQSVTPAVLSRPQSSLYEQYAPSTMLDEIVLGNQEKLIVKELLNEWEFKGRLVEHGLVPNNRLLLYGPPGTGKTMLAQAIANELGLDIVYVRLDELVSSYLGKTGKNIREIFDLAERQNVVVFLDEIDTIAKHRNDEQELGELKRVVTVLLQNIDLLSPDSILIAATNHPGLLDPALWRRFPYRLELPLPDKPSRTKLLKLLINSPSEKINYSLLADITDELSGSDLTEITSKIKRQSIISDTPLDDTLIIGSFVAEMFKMKSDRKTRKKLYSVLARYIASKYDLKKISSISGIPYTTLRDNILVKDNK